MPRIRCSDATAAAAVFSRGRSRTDTRDAVAQTCTHQAGMGRCNVRMTDGRKKKKKASREFFCDSGERDSLLPRPNTASAIIIMTDNDVIIIYANVTRRTTNPIVLLPANRLFSVLFYSPFFSRALHRTRVYYYNNGPR